MITAYDMFIISLIASVSAGLAMVHNCPQWQILAGLAVAALFVGIWRLKK